MLLALYRSKAARFVQRASSRRSWAPYRQRLVWTVSLGPMPRLPVLRRVCCAPWEPGTQKRGARRYRTVSHVQLVVSVTVKVFQPPRRVPHALRRHSHLSLVPTHPMLVLPALPAHSRSFRRPPAWPAVSLVQRAPDFPLCTGMRQRRRTLVLHVPPEPGARVALTPAHRAWPGSMARKQVRGLLRRASTALLDHGAL